MTVTEILARGLGVLVVAAVTITALLFVVGETIEHFSK